MTARSLIADKGALSQKRRKNPYRDDTEITSAVGRIIRSLGRRLAEGDPDGLANLAALELELERAWTAAVTGLRRTGFSDAQIGESIGTTKQAVQQRFPRTRRRSA